MVRGQPGGVILIMIWGRVFTAIWTYSAAITNSLAGGLDGWGTLAPRSHYHGAGERIAERRLFSTDCAFYPVSAGKQSLLVAQPAGLIGQRTRYVTVATNIGNWHRFFRKKGGARVGKCRGLRGNFSTDAGDATLQVLVDAGAIQVLVTVVAGVAKQTERLCTLSVCLHFRRLWPQTNGES